MMQNARWRVETTCETDEMDDEKRNKNPREKVAERTQRRHKSQRGCGCLLPFSMTECQEGRSNDTHMDEEKLILYALWLSSPRNRCLGGRTLDAYTTLSCDAPLPAFSVPGEAYTRYGARCPGVDPRRRGKGGILCLLAAMCSAIFF